MKLLILYIFSWVLSLAGVNLVVFSAGWEVLRLSGSSMGVGLTWSLFFTPGLVTLFILPHLLKKKGHLKIMGGLELAKLLVILAVLAWLSLFEGVVGVYLAVLLLGAFFAPFYPLVYTSIKHLAPRDSSTLSRWFEVSVQVSSILSILVSGPTFDHFGFRVILGLAAGSFAAAAFLLLFGEKILSSLHNYKARDGLALNTILSETAESQILQDVSSQKENAADLAIIVFGAVHSLPQNIVFLFNIPLILYVQADLAGNATVFSLIDTAFSAAAFLAGTLAIRYFKNTQSHLALVYFALVAGVTLLSFQVFPVSHLFAAILAFIFGLSVTFAKMTSRSVLLDQLTMSQTQRLTPYFQMVSHIFLVGAGFMLSGLTNYASPRALLGLLGSVLLVFAMSVYILLSKVRS